MKEQVIAEIILRSADGSSILDAEGGITAENIAKYRVGKEVVEKASERLEALGFKVEQAGPVGITISGDKALFEKVFQTVLQAQYTEVRGIEGTSVKASYYEAAEPLTIPEDLSLLIASVAFPIPPSLFP